MNLQIYLKQKCAHFSANDLQENLFNFIGIFQISSHVKLEGLSFGPIIKYSYLGIF